MRRWIAISAGAVLSLGMIAAVGCDNTTSVGGSGNNNSSSGGGDGGSGSGSGGGGGGVANAGCAAGQQITKTDKIDLLFSIDNSRSMADKQAILALALDDLVQSLVNPACLDAGGQPVPNQPASGSDPCPAGSTRSFAPVLDIHIGVISSSLGGHGADACQVPDQNSCKNGGTNTSNDDKGHLLSRTDPCVGASVSTYDNKGFLAWDPTAKQNPPGDADAAGIAVKFKDIVVGVGQIGCGYESQLESWYRFLVDPEPPQSVAIVNGKIELQGVDSELLAERAAFLRPDSFLMIVNLTDENDCSIKEEGQFYFAAQLKNPGGSPFRMPRPRQECATNPNDPCCASCGQMTPPGCPADPSCTDGGGIAVLSQQEDSINMRCFDQKRRFGIDFLYPTDRYVHALTQKMVPNRAGELVPNPIFSDLNPNDNITGVRDGGLVAMTGIVGVPWQDIARNKTNLGLGYKTAGELALPACGNVSGWDVILGDPTNYVAPADPLMVESIDPRAGTTPCTGDILTPPGNPSGNPINGSEFTATPDRDDLQYACVFDLDAPRDCTDPNVASCDCGDPNNDSPLCAQNGASGNTLQVRAKAYPGIRELAVLKDTCGVVASICPAQTTDAAASDYAYRPAIRGIIGRIAPHL